MIPCPSCAAPARTIATVPGKRRYHACPNGHRFAIGQSSRQTYGLSRLAVGDHKLIPWPSGPRPATRALIAKACRMATSRTGRRFARFFGHSGIVVIRVK